MDKMKLMERNKIHQKWDKNVDLTFFVCDNDSKQII